MHELEEQLRRYGDGIESLVPDVGVPAERSSRRRWPILGAAAAIVFVAVIAVTVVVSSDEGDRVVATGEDSLGDLDWQWRVIAEGPLEPTTEAVSVWTGEEMLVFGGSTTQVSTEENADGFSGDTPIRTDFPAGAAAYEPNSDSWRALASLPEGIAGGEVIWTGDEAIVTTTTSVLVYDVEDDSWSTSTLPLPDESFGLWDPAVAWTGSEVLIWAYQHRLFDQPGFLFGFDPADRTFEQYDVGPLDYRWGASGYASDSGLTVLGGSGNTVSTEAPSLDAATFDAETGTWSAFEPGPLPDVADPWVVEGDGELVVFGGSVAGIPNTRAAALSPQSGQWRTVADGGVPGGDETAGVAAWTGDEIVVVDSPVAQLGETPGPSSGALDPVTGSWRSLPDVPGGPACGSTGVWTGREFIVWGGSVGCTTTMTPRASGYRMAVGPASSATTIDPPEQHGLAADALEVGDAFEVLLVSPAGVDAGSLRAVTSEAELVDLWDRLGTAEAMPEVDFGRDVVVTFNVPDDACPPTLTGFETTDSNVLTPILVEPEGFCLLPMIPKTFVVSLDRVAVAPEFVLRRPGDETFGYEEQRLTVTVLTGDEHGQTLCDAGLEAALPNGVATTLGTARSFRFGRNVAPVADLLPGEPGETPAAWCWTGDSGEYTSWLVVDGEPPFSIIGLEAWPEVPPPGPPSMVR